MDPNKDGVLSKVDFSGSHSNILRSAESRFWTAPETCDKSEGRRREAKRADPDELIRFIARTPCCKQLFGEFTVQAQGHEINDITYPDAWTVNLEMRLEGIDSACSPACHSERISACN